MSLYHKESPLYLNECFSSLYRQTVAIPEVVCVYDGPLTEELEQVVNDWADKLPIKIIRLKENVGLGSALNEGLKHCSYELVARMDTDDICLEHRFEQQMTYMLENPLTAILGGDIYEFETDVSNITSSRKVPITNESIISFAKLKNPFNHMTVMFRKSLIISAGGYHHHFLMEDYNLWLRVLANKNQVANLSSYLVMVRAGEDMIARRKGFLYIKSEYYLAQLKYSLQLQSFIPACYVFVIRSLPRLLPISVLSYLYKKARSSS